MTSNRTKLQAFFQDPVDEQYIEGFFHPDVVAEEPPGLPYGGTYHGPAGLKALGEKMARCWSGLKVDPREIIGADDGEAFAVLADVSGKSVAHGKDYAFQVLERWSFADGKVVGIRIFYWDISSLQSAFG